MIAILRCSCDKEFHIRSFMVVWFTNLKKMYTCTNILTLFNKYIRKFIKRGYDPIILQCTACLVVNPNSWQSRFPLFIHADRKALVLYDDRPLKSWGGRGTSNHCTLSFLSYRTLITYLRLLWLQQHHGVHLRQVDSACSTSICLTCYLHLRLPSRLL